MLETKLYGIVHHFEILNTVGSQVAPVIYSKWTKGKDRVLGRECMHVSALRSQHF